MSILFFMRLLYKASYVMFHCTAAPTGRINRGSESCIYRLVMAKDVISYSELLISSFSLSFGT